MRKKPIFSLDPDQLERLLSIGTSDPDPTDEQEQQTDANKDGKDREDAVPGGLHPLGERVPSANVTASLVGTEQAGGQIGRYKLLSVLGEGGMGVVYLAEQEGQIRRKVALKVVKPGMDSKRVIARFETERQALALLDHPNIAQVYDAGTTESGRPYFVMEHVKGSPITEYCDRHKLSIEDRLILFQEVCAGLQHAHQKGIIHRDIKPSNILVSAGGDKAIPKIIDFGVAKAISQPLTERTLFTEDSQLLGTPEYMSPEQADMANEDIDTRSDIYSLGVLLYVLLAGILPYDSQTFRQGGIEHIRKTIRESDPKTPSTRLTKLGKEAGKLAESRRTEVAMLAKCLQRELEWIPLKAMCKDRSERYRSASELADDIGNYLQGAPLIAGPPGTGYKVRKFVRRNRVLVGGIAALLIVLAAGVLVSTIFAVYQARTHAEKELIINFLEDDVLGAAKEARVGEATIGFMLDSASKKLETEFESKPLIKARLSRTLGEIYRKLGDYENATQHILKAIGIYKRHRGEAHEDTLGAMGHIGWVYVKQEKYHDMEKLFHKLIEVKQQVHGVKHPWGDMHGLAVAYYCLGKYKDAELLYDEILQIVERQRQGEDLLVRHVKGVLACVYTAQGRYDKAEPLFDEVKIYSWDMANMYRQQGRYKKAESLIGETLQKQRLELGERHFNTLTSEYVLARLYIDQHRWDEAESLTSESLRIAREQLREDHPLTLRFANARAVLHTKQKEYDEAQTLFEGALEGKRSELGDDHPETLETINDIGALRREQKDHEEAEGLLRRALAGRKAKLGDDHPHTLQSMHELAVLHVKQDRHQQAADLLVTVAEGRLAKLGDKHPHTRESLTLLIDLYETLKRPEEVKTWRANLPQIEAVEE